ncbi:hypothetical protein BS78_09G105900 [Paspalum vaginatum]|nr:hypothetical protein BS78_09G105900 [Paspalum vaginatum]
MAGQAIDGGSVAAVPLTPSELTPTARPGPSPRHRRRHGRRVPDVHHVCRHRRTHHGPQKRSARREEPRRSKPRWSCVGGHQRRITMASSSNQISIRGCVENNLGTFLLRVSCM